MYKIIDKNKFYINENFYDDKVYIKESFSYLLKESELNDVSTLINIYTDESNNSNIVGNISIKLKNKEIGNIDIYTNKKKKQLSFFEWIKKLFIRDSK